MAFLTRPANRSGRFIIADGRFIKAGQPKDQASGRSGRLPKDQASGRSGRLRPGKANGRFIKAGQPGNLTKAGGRSSKAGQLRWPFYQQWPLCQG